MGQLRGVYAPGKVAPVGHLFYDARMTQAFRILAWIVLSAIAVATLSPIGLRPRLPVAVDLERAVAFFATGYLFALAYPKQIWLAVAVVMASVCGFELLQHIRPDRHGQLHDAIVKAAGASIGLGFGWLSANVLRPRNR